MKALHRIPSVEKLLQALGPTALPRAAVVAAVRRELSSLRGSGTVPEFERIVSRIRAALEVLRHQQIQPVINGTGIVIHTNLGRAPLARKAVEALTAVASGYSNLEYDLSKGERGGRAGYLEQHLALLCQAEAATAVNNCAAALVLTLHHFTQRRKEVIISRGELVQIGGGFRIPEILEASGARLREVGATNKTELADYAKAIGSDTALVLKVHRSNFFMEGFVDSPTTEDLAALCRKKRLPLVEDLGSGALMNTEQFLGASHEPTPAEILRRGVDLVTFSGDKLMGGPQAGIIAGKSRWVASLKRDPFFRALRCDKLVLAALEATVDLYLGGAPDNAIPILQMLRVTGEELETRAGRIIWALRNLPLEARVGVGQGQVGGGSLPKALLPGTTVDLLPRELSLSEIALRLRTGSPPVVGCISAGRFKLHLRTVFPAQDDALARAIRAAVEGPGKSPLPKAGATD